MALPLLSLKSVQQRDEYPYFGSFTWRWETKRFMMGMVQDAALRRGRYGVVISNFLGGDAGLEETTSEDVLKVQI